MCWGWGPKVQGILIDLKQTAGICRGWDPKVKGTPSDLKQTAGVCVCVRAHFYVLVSNDARKCANIFT